MSIGRLIRLVPGGNLEEGEEDREDKDRLGTKKLLNYRLPASNAEAKLEWLAIVEGGHWLWREVCNTFSPLYSDSAY